MQRLLIILLLIVGALSGCSFNSITMKATKPLIRSTFVEVMDEPDLVIAKTAIESNLKLLDGVLSERPKDQELLTLAAMGTFAYAYAFAENDTNDRAIKLFERSKLFALRGLAAQGLDTALLRRPVEEIDAALIKLPKSANPFLFWFSLSSAMRIMQSLDNTTLLADLPRIEAMMQHVRNQDSTYFFSGSPLFFGVLYGFRPKILGGDPIRSELEFDRCRSMNNGMFLLERVFRARYLYVTTLDEAKFRTELEFVINSPEDAQPYQRLLTAVAKAKAKLYLNHAGEWF